MLKNYLIIALRNLKKYKSFSIINITGLAVGITCFITLSLFVIDESGFDKFNERADQIYRVCINSNINGQQSCNSKTPGPLGSTLLKDFPEVISSARIGYFGQYTFRYKDKSFMEYRVYTADCTYFNIFSLPLIYGNPKTVLQQPNSIVITESSARKYFGNENPVGKTINANGNTNFLITGLMKDFPRKSHFYCDFLLSMSTYPVTESQNWLDCWYTTYILFRKGTDPKQFESKLQNTVQKYVGPQAQLVIGMSLEDFFAKGNSYKYFIQPLTSIYLYSQTKYGIDKNTEWGNIRNSSIAYTYIFIAIAVFILLIAVFNFMNLATAKAERRVKEVGIRKTLGSDKYQLIKQFISESIFTCFLSVLIAIGFTKLILPVFNNFINRDLNLEFFNNIYTIPLLILFTIIVGSLAGSYPAFYLSSFQPSHILKSNIGKSSRKHNLRSVLVIIQFAITITLIIGTIIIKDQLGYILNKDLGFRKEQLIVINNGSVLGKNLEVFKQEILRNTNVISSTSSSLMFQSGIPGNGYIFDKSAHTDIISSQFLDVDYNFAQTYGISLNKGRFFSKDFSTDSSAVVINESMAKECKSTNPIGKELVKIDVFNGIQRFKIIGVVKDFNYESLHQTVRPLVFHLGPVRQAGTLITIRVKPVDLEATMNYIEKVWKRFVSYENIFSNFMDENLADMYVSEEKFGEISTVFSFLAIFIACLGLFGLVAFVTEQRTKEIGIRKVLGASISEVVVLLSREFVFWILIANLIAWPVAYYIMHNWLQDFAYRINISWWMFAASGVIALLIALVTVSFLAIKAALANPVESLKYE